MIYWINHLSSLPSLLIFQLQKKQIASPKMGSHWQPFRAGKSRGLELAKAMNDEKTHGKTREFEFSPQRCFPWKWWAIVTKLKIYDEWILDDIIIISPSLSIGEPPYRGWNDIRESYSPFITIGSVVYRPNPKHSWPASKLPPPEARCFFWAGLIKGQTKWFFIPPLLGP